MKRITRMLLLLPATLLLPSSLLCVLAVTACSDTPDTFTNGGADIPAEVGKTYLWNFDSNAVSALPPDFITVLGTWQVAAEPSAPSQPNVMRQSGKFGDPDFPRVLIKDLTFTNFTAKLRCRPESGSTDQACGFLFRAQDSNNYYVTRANALEGNVNLYHTINRNRQQFAGASASVPSGMWSTLEVHATGTSFTVKWNGQQVISASDGTFARGKIGLWTKADSVTAFDDLEITEE